RVRRRPDRVCRVDDADTRLPAAVPPVTPADIKTESAEVRVPAFAKTDGRQVRAPDVGEGGVGAPRGEVSGLMADHDQVVGAEIRGLGGGDREGRDLVTAR